MTKPLTIAALFLVGSVAATAALIKEPKGPAHAVTTAAPLDTNERRGSRPPVVTVAAANPAVSHQPRRGERGSFELAGSPMPESSADGTRRGTR